MKGAKNWLHLLVMAVNVSTSPLQIKALCLNMEEVADVSLTLRNGTIPGWIDGRLYFNGPSVHNFSGYGVDVITEHYFDGLGGVSAFDISDSHVSLRTRLIHSETLKRLEKHGQYDSFTFGTPLSWRSLLSSPFGVLLDNTPINLYAANGSLYTTSDSSYRHRLDPGSLQTLGSHERDPVGPFGAAHPAVDPHTGQVYNYVGPNKIGLEFPSLTPTAEYLLVEEKHKTYPRRDKSKTDNVEPLIEREVIGRVWAPLPWLAHSVGLTNDYVLYRVMSERFSPSLDPSVLSNFLKMDSSQPVRVVAINRSTRFQYDVTCDQSFSSFHIINTFQEKRNKSERIVIDSVASSTGLLNERTDDIFGRGYKPERARGPASSAEPVEAESVPYVYNRCIISLQSTENLCKCSNLFQYPFELPVVNPLFKMKRHRYVWGAAGRGRTMWSNQIVKFDIVALRHGQEGVKVWNPPSGFVSGEPRMVPHPEPNGEDHGVVFAVVVHESSRDTKLVMLDASNLTEVAILDLPIDIPLQTHGIFKDRNHHGTVYPN